MHRRTRRLVLLALLSILFTTLALSTSPFSSPGIEGVPMAGQSFNITVTVDETLSDPVIRYRATDAPDWKTCQIVNGTCRLDRLEQGRYLYYFINGTNTSTRFPQQGTLRLPISRGETIWRDIAVNMTTANPSTATFGNGCTPWNRSYNSDATLNERFSCAFEHMQGRMIEGFGMAHLLTDNDTYLPYLRNLSLREYDETGDDSGSEDYATCDINNSDYRCSNRSNLLNSQAVPGARRQAALISGLTRYGQLFNLTAMAAQGRKYMDGTPESCRIWSGDTSCSTIAGQGAMTAAAWQAYKATGNETYRSKAKELSKEAYSRASDAANRSNYTAFRLIEGLWIAYEMTGNRSYRDQASMLARDDLPTCSNRSGRPGCSVENQSQAIHAALTGYEMTGNHFYVQQAVDTLRTNFSAGTCNPWNNSFRCDWADEHGVITSAFWHAYRTVPQRHRNLANPRITGERQSGTPLTFSVDIRGDVRNASLQLRQPDASWRTCRLWGFNQSCTVSPSVLAEQTVYEYRFTAGNVTFPVNGTFKLLLAHRNDSLRDHATLLAMNESGDCNPSGGDYSCEEEQNQAPMIQGYGAATVFSRNTTYRHHMNELATSEIGPDLLTACDHAENDFHCDPSVAPNGSVRQGLLINALWESWSVSRNRTARALAVNYTRNHPADCNVWQEEFTCGSQRGQGAMVQGFQAAYRATGNRTYRAIASNLSKAALSFEHIRSRRLAAGLWTQYDLTGNTTFKNATRNATTGLLRDCLDEACSTSNYSQAFDLGIRSFKSTVNESYYNLSYDILKGGNAGSCDPWDGDYSCTNADEHGAIMRTFWQAFAYDRVSVDGDVAINASTSTLTVGETLETTCSVTNTVANGSDLLDVNLTIDASGFNVSGNTSRGLGDLAPGESSNTTWTLTAETSGDQDVTCTAESSNGWTGSAATVVTVESEETGDTGGSTDDGGGGFTAPPTEEPEPTTANVSFGFEHQDSVDELSMLLAERPGFTDSLEALLGTDQAGVNRSRDYTVAHTQCLSGRRNMTGGTETVAWLEVAYTCEQSLRRLVVYDRLPRNLTNGSGVSVTTDAAQVTLDQQPEAYAFRRSNLSSGDRLLVRYRTNGIGLLDWFDRPVAVLQNQSHLDDDPPEIRLFDLPELNTTRQFIRFAVNVTDRTGLSCNVTRNGELQVQRVEALTGINTSLDEGLNRFQVSCRDRRDNVATETFTVLRRADKPGQADEGRSLLEQVPIRYLQYLGYLAGVLVVLGAAGMGYRRRQVAISAARTATARAVDRWHEYRLQRLIDRLETKFEQEDFVAVLDLYEQIRDRYTAMYGEPPGIGFWHRHIGDLGMTLRVYLLLDLSVRRAQQGSTESVLDSLDNLQALYKRFKQRNPNAELRERIEEKAEQLDALLQEQAGARFNY